MATIAQVGRELARVLGLSQIDGYLFARTLVADGHAERGRPGRGGAQSPSATAEQVVRLALAMAGGALPKGATREADEFYKLPLVGAYRAFQGDGGIQAVPIENLEAVQGARFGDVLSQIIASYRLGIDPSGLRPGLQFAGCVYGAACASALAFASLDWRAAWPDADGFRTSDHFTFLRPASVTPSAAISRQISISAEVFARLGAFLRQGGGGGGCDKVSTRAAETDCDGDLEIAAAPGAIAAASCALH